MTIQITSILGFFLAVAFGVKLFLEGRKSLRQALAFDSANQYDQATLVTGLLLVTVGTWSAVTGIATLLRGHTDMSYHLFSLFVLVSLVPLVLVTGIKFLTPVEGEPVVHKDSEPSMKTIFSAVFLRLPITFSWFVCVNLWYLAWVFEFVEEGFTPEYHLDIGYWLVVLAFVSYLVTEVFVMRQIDSKPVLVLDSMFIIVVIGAMYMTGGPGDTLSHFSWEIGALVFQGLHLTVVNVFHLPSFSSTSDDDDNEYSQIS